MTEGIIHSLFSEASAGKQQMTLEQWKDFTKKHKKARKTNERGPYDIEHLDTEDVTIPFGTLGKNGIDGLIIHGKVIAHSGADGDLSDRINFRSVDDS